MTGVERIMDGGPHAPLADEGGDVVVGDSGADCKGHSQWQSYRRKSAQIIGHARPNRSQTWAIGLCGVKGGAKLDHDGGGTLDHLAAGRSV